MTLASSRPDRSAGRREARLAPRGSEGIAQPSGSFSMIPALSGAARLVAPGLIRLASDRPAWFGGSDRPRRARRMAVGVDSDHPVHRRAVCLAVALPREKMRRAHLGRVVGVVEGKQFVLRLDIRIPVERSEPRRDLGDRGRVGPRAGQEDAQRVDVVADGVAAHQERLDRGRAPTHERVVDRLARTGEAADEESGNGA